MEERRGERTKVRNHPAYDLNERTRPERPVPMAVRRYKCRNCTNIIHVRPQLCWRCGMQITDDMELI